MVGARMSIGSRPTAAPRLNSCVCDLHSTWLPDMRALLIACCCLVVSTGRRQGTTAWQDLRQDPLDEAAFFGREGLLCCACHWPAPETGPFPAILTPFLQVNKDVAVAEAVFESEVERVDTELGAIPEAAATSWSTVAGVSQIGPSVDDIKPKVFTNFMLSTHGASTADPKGTYWLEVVMSATNAEACSQFKALVEGEMHKLHFNSRLLPMTCQGRQLHVRCLPRPLPPGAQTALQMFSAHIGHVNLSQALVADPNVLLEDKDAPILEAVFEGMRYDLDISLTKALEQVVIERLRDVMYAKTVIVDKGICSSGELPCKNSWEGACCSTSTCLWPATSTKAPNHKAEQCKFNATACIEYCHEGANEWPETAGRDLVEKVVSMFKGASSDLRLVYDDAKRRELIRMMPSFNITYNSIIKRLSPSLQRLPPHLAGQPWAISLGKVLERATEVMDALNSVELKNLPGVKVALTFVNLHPFKILSSLMRDLGVFKLLRQREADAASALLSAASHSDLGPAPEEVESVEPVSD